MGFTDAFLTDVGSQIAARDDVLAEARTRLALVRDIARTFPGALRTYGSGSLVHHTFNDPVTDGDGGVVLDRRCYPNLGPDGGGETPNDTTGELCSLLGPAVRETYPAARCGTSKRGPKIYFGVSVAGQDPTVDLVVALTRPHRRHRRSRLRANEAPIGIPMPAVYVRMLTYARGEPVAARTSLLGEIFTPARRTRSAWCTNSCRPRTCWTGQRLRRPRRPDRGLGARPRRDCCRSGAWPPPLL